MEGIGSGECTLPWMRFIAARRRVARIFAVNVPSGKDGIRGLKRESCQRHSAPIKILGTE
jgi:hypothetical protein